MSDLISIQKAIEKINERARETFTLASGYEYYLGALHDVADDLRQMPTIDAVEVVRCKDCKRWKDPHDGECPYHATGDPYIDGDPEEDFFCAYGERKDDAEQV